jgi:hypothetical protein
MYPGRDGRKKVRDDAAAEFGWHRGFSFETCRNPI